MCSSHNKLPHLFLLASLLALICFPTVTHANQPETGALATEGETTAPGLGDYSSLSQLVTVICNDAVLRFDHFFTSATVTVSPFLAMDGPTKRPSLLGIIMADQMVAMINNETSARFNGSTPSMGKQELSGLLQEIDGYLRIHISGRNEKGEQRSYVVAVEMSEPLFRVLHTYLTQ